ncbi:MAG: hypothetical protein ACK5MY_01810 [Jhaorihella sp.]
MDTDLALVLGLVLALLAVPSMVSAFSDRRAPRASVVIIAIAGGLIIYAVMAHPGGYPVADVPGVFFSVVARFWP